MEDVYRIIIPVYNGVDLMDIAAPREIFSWLSESNFGRNVEVLYVGRSGETTIQTRDGAHITPDMSMEDERAASADLIWVPGGSPESLERELSQPDSLFFEYIQRVGASAEWVCSVCEGAILLAQTGLLNGFEITTHWAFVNCFEKYPEVTVVDGHPRYHRDGNRITGGGISSGLDEAFFIVTLIASEETAISIQQTMQYYPHPPVESEIPEAGSCPVQGL